MKRINLILILLMVCVLSLNAELLEKHKGGLICRKYINDGRFWFILKFNPESDSLSYYDKISVSEMEYKTYFENSVIK